MKRVRILSLVILIVSAAAFVAFKMYSNVIVDTNPPVVTCDSEEITVSMDATEKELLQGVKAEDSRSGDVTDTLVVESLSAFTEEGTRIAVYAAVDESKNVGRCERKIIYKEYEKPRFSMTDDLCFAEGRAVSFFDGIEAYSKLDGDLTPNIKYTLNEVVDTMQPGSYPIEYRVMDSGGNIVYLNTEIEIFEKDYAVIQVELEEYLVYVKRGASFDADKYYKGASVEGQLQIKSTVDTKEEGTYYVDYIVNGPGSKGKARLVVVVQ